MKRPSYSSEFKRETVKYILEHSLSISAASEKFGVGQRAGQSLYENIPVSTVIR